jgi:ABC-2 type transport system permease protein
MRGVRALHAEWTKLRTVPSTAWLVLATVFGAVALGAGGSASVQVDQCPPEGCFEDTTRLSLLGVHAGQLLVAVLAVLAVGSEYASGQIRTTLTAVPGRLRAVGAKAAVVTGTALAAGAPAVLASLAVARLILPRNGFTPDSLSAEPTLRATVGTMLYLGLVALLSLGVALLVRDTAVALTVVVAVLYLVPFLAQFVRPRVAEVMLTYSPMTAGLAIQNTRHLDLALIGPWTGLGVLAVWAGGALTAGVVRFLASDSQ